jgi:biotin carboxyl carrier protein
VQFELEISGRLRQVRLARSGERFTITIDGRTFDVVASLVDVQTLSILLPTDASVEITLSPGTTSGQRVVTVGTTAVDVTVNSRRRSRVRDDGHSSGTQRLVAPMPGKVVRIMAGQGDRVLARQPIVVVEAMKMENELRAARDGRVAEIYVKEGESVERGTLLAVIEADP